MYEQLGGIEAVQQHVASVGEYLYDELAKLHHSNGNRLVRVFGKHALKNRQVPAPGYFWHARRSETNPHRLFTAR